MISDDMLAADCGVSGATFMKSYLGTQELVGEHTLFKASKKVVFLGAITAFWCITI